MSRMLTQLRRQIEVKTMLQQHWRNVRDGKGREGSSHLCAGASESIWRSFGEFL